MGNVYDYRSGTAAPQLHLAGWIDGKNKKQKTKNNRNVLGFRTGCILNMHVSYFSIANDPAYQWAALIKVWFNIKDWFSSSLTNTNEMLAYGVLRQHGSCVWQLDCYGWQLCCRYRGSPKLFRKLIRSHFNHETKGNLCGKHGRVFLFSKSKINFTCNSPQDKDGSEMYIYVQPAIQVNSG